MDQDPEQAPNPAANTPGRRRRRRWIPQRDSLALRRRKGRPGSRRYNRYLNALYLNAAEDYEESDENEFESVVWEPEWTSLFEQLFDDEHAEAWEPFREITEEKENDMLVMLCEVDLGDSSDEEEPTPEEIAHAAFLQLDSATRRLMKKDFGVALVQSLEVDFNRFFGQTSLGLESGEHEYYKFLFFDDGVPSLQLCFKNAKDRRICHGVCEYYSLMSYSENVCGERITCVVNPQDSNLSLPPLSEYLARNFLQS